MLANGQSDLVVLYAPDFSPACGVRWAKRRLVTLYSSYTMPINYLWRSVLWGLGRRLGWQGGVRRDDDVMKTVITVCERNEHFNGRVILDILGVMIHSTVRQGLMM